MPEEAALPSAGADRTAGPSWRWAAAAILAAGGIVFIAGLASHVLIADEVYHYGFAEAWAKAGLLARPTHNPLYGADAHGWYYASEPLWPMGLSLVWQATGISQAVAQLYQAAWYMLLMLGCYLLGRRILGPRGALAALLLAIGVPMFAAFSVMLYVDVPGTALATLALVLVLDRRYFWAGLLLGLAYLTKRPTLFLAPPAALWAILEAGPFWQRVRRVLLLAAPMVAVVIPESVWTHRHIPVEREPLSLKFVWEQLLTVFSKNQMPSSLLSPRDLLQYFGLVMAGLGVLYLARRAWAPADRRLWLAMGLFMVPIVLFFAIDTDIRYVMPAVPLLAVAAARGLAGWWDRRWVLPLLGAAAFAHLGATAWYVGNQRHLAPGPAAVVEFLKTRTPEGTLLLYPGEDLMAEAKRPVLWANLRDPATGLRRRASLVALMAERDPQKVLNVLRANDIRYLIIDQDKVYDDRKDPRPGGYPLSFIERLPTMPFLQEVPGDWPRMQVWKVNYPAEDKPS